MMIASRGMPRTKTTGRLMTTLSPLREDEL
jgi:hypothetical protein